MGVICLESGPTWLGIVFGWGIVFCLILFGYGVFNLAGRDGFITAALFSFIDSLKR